MLKRLKPEKYFQVNIKVTAKEKRKLMAQAKKYANGNISAWIRYSALNLKPDPKDLADE